LLKNVFELISLIHSLVDFKELIIRRKNQKHEIFGAIKNGFGKKLSFVLNISDKNSPLSEKNN
jgi:hypothetical protein